MVVVTEGFSRRDKKTTGAWHSIQCGNMRPQNPYERSPKSGRKNQSMSTSHKFLTAAGDYVLGSWGFHCALVSSLFYFRRPLSPVRPLHKRGPRCTGNAPILPFAKRVGIRSCREMNEGVHTPCIVGKVQGVTREVAKLIAKRQQRRIPSPWYWCGGPLASGRSPSRQTTRAKRLEMMATLEAIPWALCYSTTKTHAVCMSV